MLRRLFPGLALLLMAGTASAQTSGIQIFRLPDTGTSYQWVKLERACVLRFLFTSSIAAQMIITAKPAPQAQVLS